MPIYNNPSTKNNLLNWFKVESQSLGSALPFSDINSISTKPFGFTSVYGNRRETKQLLFDNNLPNPNTSPNLYFNKDLSDLVPLANSFIWKYAVLSTNGTILLNNQTPNILDINGTNYHLYIDNLDFSTISPQCACLAIYNNITNQIAYLSDEFKIVEPNFDAFRDYVVIEFNNNGVDLGDFYYSLLPPTFKQRFLLPDVLALPEAIDEKIQAYNEVTTGRVIASFAQMLPNVTLRFYRYDEGKHLALQTAFNHTNVVVNQVVVTKGENTYDVQTSEERNGWLYNADLKLYLSENSFNIKYC